MDQPLVELFLCHFKVLDLSTLARLIPFFLKKSVKVVIGNFDFVPLAKEETKVTYER